MRCFSEAKSDDSDGGCRPWIRTDKPQACSFAFSVASEPIGGGAQGIPRVRNLKRRPLFSCIVVCRIYPAILIIIVVVVVVDFVGFEVEIERRRGGGGGDIGRGGEEADEAGERGGSESEAWGGKETGDLVLRASRGLREHRRRQISRRGGGVRQNP